MSDSEKTEEMEKYEKETGKFAIWRGVVTEGFKKWQKGEKIYEQDKERITILVSEEKKNKWQNFAKKGEFSSISKLIRVAVDSYIEAQFHQTSFRTISKITHGLKEPLTLIKGFSHIILENYKDDLKWDVLVKINDIFDQSQILEKRINEISKQQEPENENYEILIVDDDISTIKVLANFFQIKGYKSKSINSGAGVLGEIIRNNPQIILLDIMLPDISGYEICKQIKRNDNLKTKRVYFISAIPRDDIEKKMDETKANGYFLKPFNFSELKELFKYL
ncbi:MAG: response regulator transcription factor [Candidatus Lokiarchaeota archaeon]|nr:response regulator transcription factor [Candidatus Lokiarchaeota archaeon]